MERNAKEYSEWEKRYFRNINEAMAREHGDRFNTLKVKLLLLSFVRNKTSKRSKYSKLQQCNICRILNKICKFYFVIPLSSNFYHTI